MTLYIAIIMMNEYNPPKNPSLNVIFDDKDIIVLNKSAGLLSVPGKDPQHADSLQNRAIKKFNDALIIHRLDMDTSGLIILARHKAAHRHLSIQFQDRKILKEYEARVYGYVQEDEGLIDLPLICDWPNRPKQIVNHEVGKPSQTKWRVILRQEMETRLLLTPITGRSHQLRVHLQNIEHPILGDRFYAHKVALKMSNRLCLHATSLTITHPNSLETMTFNCKPEF